MKKDSEKNPWTTLSVKEVYDNPWIKITHEEVLTPANTPGIYGKVHFKNTAIGIVPLDESDHTWLVGQYRYTLNDYHWEIPEGGGPLGTDPLDSAKRELLEETGITARSWTKILELHTSNSVTDEHGVAYVARDLSFGESEPEETEDLKVIRVPFSEAVAMVMDGRITDALSMVAIMKVAMMKNGSFD